MFLVGVDLANLQAKQVEGPRTRKLCWRGREAVGDSSDDSRGYENIGGGAQSKNLQPHLALVFAWDAHDSFSSRYSGPSPLANAAADTNAHCEFAATGAHANAYTNSPSIPLRLTEAYICVGRSGLDQVEAGKWAEGHC